MEEAKKPGEVKRLLIFGSRTLADQRVKDVIVAEIEKHQPSVLVTAGEPAGVCEVARELAKELAIPLSLHYLNLKHNQGKYHHRSVNALKDCDHCVLIHDGASLGTKNELVLAKKMLVPYTYHELRIIADTTGMDEAGQDQEKDDPAGWYDQPGDQLPLFEGKRPSTKMRKKAMISALQASFGVISEACTRVGIDRQTHYNWLEKDPKYKEAVRELGDLKRDFVESKLLSLVKNNDTAATIFASKTLLKERGYVERTELTGKDGAHIEHKITHEIRFKNSKDPAAGGAAPDEEGSPS